MGKLSSPDAPSAPGGRATIASTVQELIREGGPSALMRGVVPRTLSTMMWGTAMVTAYEFLKRISAKEPI